MLNISMTPGAPGLPRSSSFGPWPAPQRLPGLPAGAAVEQREAAGLGFALKTREVKRETSGK